MIRLDLKADMKTTKHKVKNFIDAFEIVERLGTEHALFTNGTLKQFDIIKKIALKYELEPAALMKMFFTVGLMCLNQTVYYLDRELKEKLKEIFPDDFKKISDVDYSKLLKIFKSKWNL